MHDNACWTNGSAISRKKSDAEKYGEHEDIEYPRDVLQGRPTGHTDNPIPIYNGHDAKIGTGDGDGKSQGSDSQKNTRNDREKMWPEMEQ